MLYTVLWENYFQRPCYIFHISHYLHDRVDYAVLSIHYDITIDIRSENVFWLVTFNVSRLVLWERSRYDFLTSFCLQLFLCTSILVLKDVCHMELSFIVIFLRRERSEHGLMLIVNWQYWKTSSLLCSLLPRSCTSQWGEPRYSNTNHTAYEE